MVSTGQSCPHSADSSREGAGQAEHLGQHLPHSSSYFTYEAKPVRGVSTSPRSSSRSPAPSLPRGQAHSSPPTPTPRGPNTGRGPALLPARCQPQPSPAARPGMMLALQGFASYKTLGHGTPLPGRELELGAGGRDGHAQGSQCPRSQSPDRHWDRLAREGTGCSGRGHSRGHQPLG